MTSAEIKERIEKKEQALEKKAGTIEKKTGWIAKIGEALKRLHRLKVWRLCYMADSKSATSTSFVEIWWAVLHEVDMYVEGEFTVADGGMNKAQAKRADEWLIETADLAKWSAIETGLIKDFGYSAFDYYGQV